MPAAANSSTARRARTPDAGPLPQRVDAALAWLRQHATAATRDGMTRYAIPNGNALGVRMADIQRLGRQLGRDPELAAALWDTGVYEARLLCAYVDDPAALTPQRMDAYCREFDSWAVCDTLCFALFDRSPHAWTMIDRWVDGEAEFVRRAAYALLASIALHDKRADPAKLRHGLRLVERHARDPRNFVKKSISWALRGVARRLQDDALAVARTLAASSHPTERWIGKDALKGIK